MTKERDLLVAQDAESNLSDLAKEIWRKVFPHLVDLQILNQLDIPKVMRYCEMLVRWRACCDFLSKHGDVYPMKGRGGRIISLIPYPQAKLIVTYGRALDAMEKELGMSPASRATFAAILAGIKGYVGPDDDPFASYGE